MTTNDIDCILWSRSNLVEDDDLDEVLRIAESINANPISDKSVDLSNIDPTDNIDPTLFDILSSAPTDLAAVDQYIATHEADDMESTEAHELNEMLMDDTSLMSMLSEFVINSNKEFQPTETLKKEPDSYFPEQQPMLKQLSILQLLECGWPFGDYQPFSYWSAPKEHLAGPSPFHWSQYNISPPPSVSSSPSSSPLSSPSPPLFNYPNFVYPGVMAHHVANCQFGAAELPLMSTPVRPSKHRRSLSDGDDSSCSSGPVSRRPRSGNRRIRQGKANKMKVFHLWEFIHELLNVSELQQQAMHRGCEPNQVAPVIWESKEQGVFRVVDSKRLAKLWGEHKHNKTMTYEKLSRSLRWCRSSGFLSEVPKNANYPKKLCFRFGQRAFDMYAARRQGC